MELSIIKTEHKPQQIKCINSSHKVIWTCDFCQCGNEGHVVNERYDLLFCSGCRAKKWDPEEDWICQSCCRNNLFVNFKCRFCKCNHPEFEQRSKDYSNVEIDMTQTKACEYEFVPLEYASDEIKSNLYPVKYLGNGFYGSTFSNYYEQ